MGITKDFGQRIKELRLKKGITQYQLAEAAGVDPKHISHIETGRSFPKADLIEKFAKVLDVDYTEFFKFQHLNNRDLVIKDINKMINNLSYDNLSVVQKLIASYVY